jgi:hypothetical protein
MLTVETFSKSSVNVMEEERKKYRNKKRLAAEANS